MLNAQQVPTFKHRSSVFLVPKTLILIYIHEDLNHVCKYIFGWSLKIDEISKNKYKVFENIE